MKCLNPTVAYQCGTRAAKDGVISPHLVFSPNDALDYFLRIAGDLNAASNMMDKHTITVPCGKCASCQMRKRKDFAIRLTHEYKMHDDCCFITLTYNDDSIPCIVDVNPEVSVSVHPPKELADGSFTKSLLVSSTKETYVLERGCSDSSVTTLVPADVQRFIKRLRRHLEYLPKKASTRVSRDHVDHPIRYFAVGEYGSKFKRPHYHIMFFGWRPSDMALLFRKNGHDVFVSPQLQKLWKFGFSTVCEVNVGVAKYCARYVTKKFARLNDDDSSDESFRVPEFTLQSVKDGGIGAPWFDQFGKHEVMTGFVTCDNGIHISRCTIPQYYISRLRKKFVSLYCNFREMRLDFIRNHPISISSQFDDTVRQLAVIADRDKKSIERETF